MKPIRAVATILLACSIFSCSIFNCEASVRPPQARNKISREQASAAIRQSAYEMMKAFLTVDARTFKQRASRRTLQLVTLVFEAARVDPKFQDELRTARITNPEEFLTYFLQGMANRYLQSVPLSPEAAARKAVDASVISFVNDSEAKILVGDSEFAGAKLVAKEWKIDLTETLRKPVLKEITDPVMRAKIASL